MFAYQKFSSQWTLDFARKIALDCIDDEGFREYRYPDLTQEEVNAILESNIYTELN